MGLRRFLLGAVTLGVLADLVSAQGSKKMEPPNLGALFSGGTPNALAGSLRGYLVRSLPEPLYDASPNWGHKAHTAWGLKKQGVWRKIRVTALNPADSLVLDVRDLWVPEPGRMTFTTFLAFDARAELTRQRWEAGVKLLDTSVRARFRVRLQLGCEATARLEPGGLLLPEAVFRLRVLQSRLEVENLVVEHIAGVGGDAAELFGDLARSGLRQWHPSLERDLIARAEAAVVKAGDTKEVRLTLAQLWRKRTHAGPVAP
jgi:hypothetical protein